jgi:aminopeptidase
LTAKPLSVRIILCFFQLVKILVDQRLNKLARLVINYSVNVRSKEKVLIQGSDLAFPLINELYKECLLNDAYPWIRANLDVQHTFYTTARQHQLQFVLPVDRFIAENFDVMIGIFCESNPKRLTNVDPEKIKIQRAARREIAEISFKREAEGKYRWNGLPYPASPEAQEASIALPEYEDFVYNSCFVDEDDPIAEWKKVDKEQEKICNFLNKAEEIHVVGEGTDLTFGVKGRKWISCSGQRNMPDGEVFTAPVENSANGTVRFSFPGIFSGREIEDIKLTFKGGKVVKASAAKGDELLKQLLKIDGADRLGETAIGTNHRITRFTKNMLFDEKMGGTIHMALGMNTAPETGGLNKSALHWDILKDMKRGSEICADDRLFYKNGKFLDF